MSTRRVRRALRVSGGALVSAGACVAVGLGWLDADALDGSTPPAWRGLLLCALAALLFCAIARRLRFSPPSARAQRTSIWVAMAPTLADLEVALALAAGLHAAIALTGGADSALYPLVYAVVAFSATFQTRGAAVVTVLVLVALEVTAALRAGVPAWGALAFHLFFIAGAALLHAAFLRGFVSRQRTDHERRVEEAVRVQRESARDYRFIAAALGADSRAPRSRRDEEEMLAAGAVAAVSANAYYTLGLLQKSLGARTCALFWLDERGERLKVKELVSDADDVSEAPSVAVAGVLGAVIRDRSALLVPHVRPGQLPYYEGKVGGAFVGVPVVEGGHLRGVLCADREGAFDERDASLLAGAAEQILHSVRTEQVFAAVERAKYEHERFYQASAMLCQALTIEQVMETAFDAATAIVDYDVAIVTLYDAETRRHRVHSVRVPEGAPALVNESDIASLEYRDNAGLVAMVVKNKHHLPAAGELRDNAAPIFTRKVRFRGVESLLVLPLLSADEAIGTFTLASHRKSQFRTDTREMLGVIANQVAISVQNALMYKKMETMATTDGLTGLTNHRTFQERFAQLLERSERHGHKAAVLLCDVDHFKNVNDTYGHPVGDEVLRRVAKVLDGAVRKIDIPARYGGEEFAVVLEATDLPGAVALAERIRMDVGKLSFESDKGPFSVTMSVGVSAFPDDATTKADLIERADLALYHAKESGRNRVVAFRDFDAHRRAKRAS